MDDVSEIAGKMTGGGKRALLRINSILTEEGFPGPKREDAYSLWWGKSNFGLIEMPRCIGGRWHYRLTPLGLAVKAHLINTEGER